MAGIPVVPDVVQIERTYLRGIGNKRLDSSACKSGVGDPFIEVCHQLELGRWRELAYIVEMGGQILVEAMIVG